MTDSGRQSEPAVLSWNRGCRMEWMACAVGDRYGLVKTEVSCGAGAPNPIFLHDSRDRLAAAVRRHPIFL